MNEWMNHPAMKDIDPVKLELIKTAARQTEGKSGRNMAASMMALITSARKQGIRFSPEEMSLIIEVLKEGKSESEKRQIDQMVTLVSGMTRRANKKQADI